MRPCKSCAGKIPVGRLNALPYSTLCIECQREMEHYPSAGGSEERGQLGERLRRLPL